jgi:PAS domain S-box-containing protein
MPLVHKPQPIDLSDEGKTREQLLSELRELKVRMTILENTESESKHSREALVISEREAMGLDAMLESIAAGVVIYDSSGSIVRMNNVAMDLFQYSLDQYRQPVQQRGVRLQMCKLDGTPYLPDELPYVRVMKGEIIRDEEMIVSLSSGKTVWLSATLSPIRVKNSQEISGIVFVFTDITERKRMEEALRRSHDELEQRVGERTVELQRLNNDMTAKIEERKQAEEALRESEEKYRTIIETANEGIWGIDRDAKTIFVNQRMAEMLGCTIEEMIGRSVFDFIFPDRYSKGIIIRDAALSGKRTYPDLKYKRKDGSILWAIVSSSPIYDNRGEIIGSYGMYTDITERKNIEQELADAKVQAELYLDLMGHDISNMHQVAMGQLELAQDILDTDGKLEADDREMIDTSLTSLWRSAKLIDNVRKLQKIRSNEVKNIEISLDEVMAGSIRQYDGLYPDKSIKADYGEGPHIVMANELLRDVFTNLIGNAIKHTNGSKVDISVKLEDILDNCNKYYKISIEDNGPGITDDMKDKIFNRLQRGDTKARGVGLGLYLVRSLVESYSGKVWVEDRVQGDYTNGSRFVVMLPAAKK